MAIIDHIISGKWKIPPGIKSYLARDYWDQRKGSRVHVIDASEVGSLVMQDISEDSDLPVESTITSPIFKEFFIYANSPIIVSGDPPKNVPVSALVHSMRLDSDTLSSGCSQMLGLRVKPDLGGVFFSAILFVEAGFTFEVGHAQWATDSMGKIIESNRVPNPNNILENDARRGVVLYCGESGKDNVIPEYALPMARRVIHLVLRAMSLLSCKNVHTVERPCDPKLVKRYEQRHGHKRPRYYVLDIEPMKQKFRDANGGNDGIALAKALHICRGHFKNFDEKPLFGKLKGTYWWAPSVRGSAEAGIVDKDYKIKIATEE